jgi:hypothetical protein
LAQVLILLAFCDVMGDVRSLGSLSLPAVTTVERLPGVTLETSSFAGICHSLSADIQGLPLRLTETVCVDWPASARHTRMLVVSPAEYKQAARVLAPEAVGAIGFHHRGVDDEVAVAVAYPDEEVVLHELVHGLLRCSRREPSLWFNEGVAILASHRALDHRRLHPTTFGLNLCAFRESLCQLPPSIEWIPALMRAIKGYRLPWGLQEVFLFQAAASDQSCNRPRNIEEAWAVALVEFLRDGSSGRWRKHLKEYARLTRDGLAPPSTVSFFDARQYGEVQREYMDFLVARYGASR